MYEKTGELWEEFVKYARNNGIEFRLPEDYEPYWKCWYTAVHKDEKLEVS